VIKANISQTPLVTIGIPTYSRFPYLKQAVASAQAQTYWNIEILISQNPHNDPVVTSTIARYCEGLSAQDSRVRYQLHPRNLGPPANFNSIADAARGDYLALIGDDDRLMSNAIERMVSVFDSNTAVVFTNRHIIDAAGQRVATKTCEFTKGYGRERLQAGKVPNPEVCAWQQASQTECSLVRTTDFRRIRFREDIDMPDVVFFILLAREGGEFLFLPEYLSEYRLHENSTTGKGFRSHYELVTHLSALAVSPEAEPYKRRLLENLMHGAVAQCLREGAVDQGPRLLAGTYYPAGAGAQAKRLVMTLGAIMPNTLGAAVYKALYAITYGRALRSATQ
jgi:glycosyltransferase involved in cell wall biosynthesis